MGDVSLVASAIRHELFCLSHFPPGSREQILATAYTLAPGESEECEEKNGENVVRWRMERIKDRVYIDLALGPCGFWSGSPENLPPELP